MSRVCSANSVAAGWLGLAAAPAFASMAAINLRCVDHIDLAALHPQKIDGRSF